MNGSCYQLLAGATLAGNEGGRFGRGDAGNKAVHGAHGRAFADHVVLDIDLRLEALVLDDRFAAVFNEDERDVARNRLVDFGYAPTPA